MPDNITLQDIYDAIIMPTADNHKLTSFVKIMSEDLTVFAERDYNALEYATIVNIDKNPELVNKPLRERVEGLQVTDDYQEVFEAWNKLSKEEISELNRLGQTRTFVIRASDDKYSSNVVTLEDLNLSEQGMVNIQNFIELKDSYLEKNKETTGASIGLDYDGIKKEYQQYGLPNININSRMDINDVILNERDNNPAVEAHYTRPTEMLPTKELKELGEKLKIPNSVKSERVPAGIIKDGGNDLPNH